MKAKETILDKLILRAQEEPDRRLYTLVDDKGMDRESLTAGQLLSSALSLAEYLGGELGVQAGDRVILCYPPSLDFVTALFGCLVAGIIPVPVAPPNPLKNGYDKRTFSAIAENSMAMIVLTNGEYDRARKLGSVRNLFRRRQGRPDFSWHRSDTLPNREIQDPALFRASPDDLALLQYTSGSTATPKGVMITHGNINHQLWLNHTELDINETSRGVFWVPHFHDFGLISGILSAVYNNMAVTMMSPLDYLRRPALWFEVMSRVRATHTAAPDFAFRLAVRKTTAEQRRSWDLSSLQIVMSAAEPIHSSTVDAFLGAFSTSNLDPQAFCPSYGLAEHTVGVSVFGRKRLHVNRAHLERDRLIVVSKAAGPDSITLVGCGQPSTSVKLRIVDPDTGQVNEPGKLGEIWVDSASKAAGYFGQPASNKELFQAALVGEDTQNRYLRTGDLGFIAEGELFIAGRLKDMINAYGRNIYPQDLEETLPVAHDSIRPGRTVAFSIPASGSSPSALPQEAIAVMVEVKTKRLPADQLEEIVQAVRAKILVDHQLPLQTVIVVPKGTVMKTTSGKLRRSAHRQAFMDGALAGQALRIDVSAEDIEASVEDGAFQIESPRRVAVIGGGVSGLTAAYELQRLGHQVTVFERESRVGGKVQSIQVGDRPYDIGGALVTDSYYGLRQFADEIGVGLNYAETLQQVDEANPPLSAADLRISDPEFRQHYKRVKAEMFPNILQVGLVHESEALATSTGEWLRKQGLETIASMDVGLIYTAFGYGYLESKGIPTAYFLKYLETTGNPSTGKGGQTSFVSGSMAALWERLAGRLEDVRCNADVTQIRRTNHHVQVISNGESFTFDNLILAMPFEKSAAFLDTSNEEAALFSRIRTLDYYTTLCSVDGLRQGEGFMVKQYCLDPGLPGHVLFGGGHYPDTNIFLFGAYGDPRLTGDDIIDILKKDLAQMGARLTAVHAQRRWRYMPHVSESDIREGYYRRFERMQGQNRTFYVGSLLNMETIESNVAYAYELVRRNFKPASYDIDRRLPYLHLAAQRRPDGINDIDQVKDWLLERIAAGLGIRKAMIDPSISLDALAMDSLRAMQVVSQIEAKLGVTISQDWLLQGITIDELADQLMRLQIDGQTQPATVISPSYPGSGDDIQWEEGAL